MKFTYTYRSSDGQRHTGEIEAESRDAAFAAIRREMGVKPIKVTAAGGVEPSESEKNGMSGSGRAALVAAAALIAAAIAGGAWWLATRNGQPPDQFTVNTPQGPITYTVAQSMSRQMIPGDRSRINSDVVFQSPVERLLARFAEPGRAFDAPSGEKPAETEFAACLREPIRVASTDFTEVVDLKRIVAGIKREMRAYLAGGGTVDGYIAELEKRQRLEISYRENAQRRLREMLSNPKEAYAYWLKANAQLQAIGIYPLAMPESLRSYQTSLDIDD